MQSAEEFQTKGQIKVENLKEMAKDMSGSERASAAKKVLAAIEDSA